MPTRHIVLAKVRPDVPLEQVDAAFADLASLVGQIPGLLSCQIGANNSPESTTQGYTHGFVMDFVDATARDAYLPHPLHRQAAARFREIREPGGVLVFDFDLTG